VNQQVDWPGGAPPGRLLSGYLRGLGVIDRVSYVAIVLAMGGMTLLVSMQVLARYAFGTSIDSADELSRLFFVWAIFLAIPHGIKTGLHVGIDVLVTRFSRVWRMRLEKLTTLCSVLLMSLVLWYAIVAIDDKWQELMPTIEVTSAVFYMAVMVCAVHSLLHLCAQLLVHGDGQQDAHA